ncbi:MAG: OmpH family outer membrane protein [Phycisphaerae bacterium]|nr:OmpH family outer membrane protein [Phycisphaerae bacterium]
MNRSIAAVAVLSAAFLAAAGVAKSMGQPGSTTAAPPATGNARHPVGVLNLVRVFNECDQIRDLNEQIKQKTDELAKEANQRREVIEQKQLELSAFQAGTPDYEARRNNLVRLNVEANVWFKMEEEELERQKFYWTRIIYEKAVDMAAELAKERSYDVVLQRTKFEPFEIEQTVQMLRRLIQDRTVLYNVPDVDITDTLIGRLNAAYKAGGGKKQLEMPTQPPSFQPMP